MSVQESHARSPAKSRQIIVDAQDPNGRRGCAAVKRCRRFGYTARAMTRVHRVPCRCCSPAAARRPAAIPGTIPTRRRSGGANIFYTSFIRAAQAPRPGAVVLGERVPAHRQHLQAAAAVPLPQAALRADPVRCASRCPRPRTTTRTTARCRTTPTRTSIAYSVYEIHISPASGTSRIRRSPRTPTGRPLYLTLDAARICADVYAAARLQADRHARADRRRLRLPDQAARAPAPALADLRADERVHRRPEGLCAEAARPPRKNLPAGRVSRPQPVRAAAA